VTWILAAGGYSTHAEVIFHTIEGGGHKWLGGQPFWQFWLSGNRSREFDASELIWEFFRISFKEV
jgi:poly(3-hydroxybutyrate) depolymerase